MKPEDFDFVSQLVKERSGLVLTKDKAYLLESRLMPMARKRGMKGLDELVQTIRMRREENLIREMTEAMTTNESFFFRDIKPFDMFRDNILPKLLELAQFVHDDSVSKVQVGGAGVKATVDSERPALLLAVDETLAEFLLHRCLELFVAIFGSLHQDG